jgi:hypothetical protein
MYVYAMLIFFQLHATSTAEESVTTELITAEASNSRISATAASNNKERSTANHSRNSDGLPAAEAHADSTNSKDVSSSRIQRPNSWTKSRQMS